MSYHKDPVQWPKMLERFERARQMVGNIFRSDIVTPGKMCESEESNCFYYVVPYAPVRTLEEVLAYMRMQRELEEDKPVLSKKQALDILYWLALVLANLHGKKLVHRDIKPGHILCHADGSLLLTGFTLLKRRERSAGRSNDATDTMTGDDLSYDLFSETEERETGETKLTQGGRYLGTPAYLSPEQLVDAVSVSCRADVWSWGVIAFELLTGYNYFNQGTRRPSLLAVHHFKSFGEIAHRLPKEVQQDQQLVQILYKTLVKESREAKISRISSRKLVALLRRYMGKV